MQYNAPAAVYWRSHGIFQSPPDSFIPMGIEELLHRRMWHGALALHHSPTARRAAAAPRAAAPVPCLLAGAPPAAAASGCPSRGSFSSSWGAQVNATPLLLRSARRRRLPPRAGFLISAESFRNFGFLSDHRNETCTGQIFSCEFIQCAQNCAKRPKFYFWSAHHINKAWKP
jgi:hypothetical protein